MDLKFPCPTCNTELTVDDALSGQTFACPSCQGKVTVPASQSARSGGKPPPPSSASGSAAPPPSSRASGAPPPPPSKPVSSDVAPEDAVLDQPEDGRYSAGFLSPVIDRKMADLRTTTNSLFLGISSQRFKLVGDICLLMVAVLWLGTSIWDEIKADDPEGGGDAAEMAEQKEEDDTKAAEEVSSFIMESREEKVKESIRRKIVK